MAARRGGLASLSGGQRALVGLAVFIAIFLGYYLVRYRSMSDDLTLADDQFEQLNAQNRVYNAKKLTYTADRIALLQKQERQRQQLKMLPKEAEISSFLSSLSLLANASGLSMDLVQPQDEEASGFYVKIPVKLRVSGRYHQLAKFFYSVGTLERIINMENIELGEPFLRDGDVLLKAQSLATTFRSIEENAAPGPAGSAPAAPPSRPSGPVGRTKRGGG